jgi:hypothetical protein
MERERAEMAGLITLESPPAQLSHAKASCKEQGRVSAGDWVRVGISVRRE